MPRLNGLCWTAWLVLCSVGLAEDTLPITEHEAEYLDDVRQVTFGLPRAAKATSRRTAR